MRQVSYKTYDKEESNKVLRELIQPLFEQIRELCIEHSISFIGHVEVCVGEDTHRTMSATTAPAKPTTDLFLELRKMIRGNAEQQGGFAALFLGLGEEEPECQCEDCQREREETRKRNLS